METPDLVNKEDASREDIYAVLLPAVEELLKGEADVIANLSNLSALLMQALKFHWVGFYRRIEDKLILGPFQGPVACSRIPITEGVCGACVREKRTIIVPDVSKFTGHIACSSLSKSEIVVPLMEGKEVKLVLDIDSDKLDDFSDLDKENLEKVVSILKGKYII